MPPADDGGELGVALQGVGQPPEQVVEVDHAPAGLLGLVPLVERGDLAGRAGSGPPGGGDGRLVALGGDQPGLGPLDLAGHLGRFGPDRRAAAEQGGEDPRLALEQRRDGLAPVEPAPAQLCQGQAVERART